MTPPQAKKAQPPPPTPSDRRRPATGLEDITRSLRVLTRSGRDLAVEGGEVLERELSMAVSISERLRDESFSAQAIERARAGRLGAQLRQDAHRLVDLVGDIGGVAVTSAVRFVEQLADEPRPRLAADSTDTGGGGGQVSASA